MKKIAIISFVLALGMVSFSSCKKGENDPGLSFKSRNARLCQKWQMKSAEITSIRTSEGKTITAKSVFNGSKFVTIIDGKEDGSFTFSNVITFDKDGTFEETRTVDSKSSISKGIWYWLDKNKAQKISKKEAILLSYTNDDGGTHSGKSMEPSIIQVIDKLSSKELVLIIDEVYKEEDGTQHTTSGKMTFESK